MEGQFKPLSPNLVANNIMRMEADRVTLAENIMSSYTFIVLII